MCEGCFEKIKEIDRLKVENERLRKKLYRYEKKTKYGYFGSSTPSSKTPFKKNTIKHNNGGAKKGHNGFGRKSFDKNKIDKILTIKVEEKQCPYCNNILEKKGFNKRSIIDKEEKNIENRVYKLEKKQCPHCKKLLTAKANLLPNSLYGNQIISEILVRHYIDMIPMNRIISMYNIPSSNGCMFELTHRIAKIIKPSIDFIIKNYRESKVIHADETSWRQDGKSGYCWIFTSKKNIIFDFADNRSSEIPNKILGLKKLKGTLVVDRYGAYNKSPCKIQYCLEHLKRSVKDLGKEFPKEKEVQCFVNSFQSLLVKAIKLRKKHIKDKIYYKQARKLKEKIIKMAETPSRHQGIKSIQYIFLNNANRLYHWVNDRDIPADNNKAERELRPTVIARKISFGSQSKKGAETRSILMTALQTAKKRLKNISIVTWLKNVLDEISINPKTDIYSLFP